MSMNIRNRLLLFALTFASTASLLSMESSLMRVQRETAENERQFNEVDCRPFVTLTAMQTAPRFYSLEGYVKQLTNNDTETMQTDMGSYKRMDPAKWHMSLITLALPLTDRLFALSKDESQKGKYFGESRAYANQALKDLADIIAKHVKRLKGIEFTYNSIGGIGTNKFIAAYFDFKNPVQKAIYEEVCADIISEFLNKYPTTWLRYGFELLPHVSVMKKYYGEQPKPKIEGAVCKGSGSGLKKTAIRIAPAVPVIENLELLYNNRDILVSSRGKGYPVAETHAKAAQYYKNGELLVDENGGVSQWER